jgi:hypothetical protein
MLKLFSSDDGTYNILLIKPDDEIKVIQIMDRSIEIAYNPAAVGEFTCAAFTDSAAWSGGISDITSHAVLKSNPTSSGSLVTDSVNTYNIMQEEIFNSLQLTLNGLDPDTTYDIYCFHLMHGVISNTGASVKTDLAALTSVSLQPDSTSAGGAITTLTLTFTHEKALAGSSAITVELYHDYDTMLNLANTADCAGVGVLETQSDGVDINGAETCTGLTTTDKWVVTLHNTGSSAAGSVVTLVLTNPSSMIPANPATGTITFHLEVTGHRTLLHRDGWTV